MWQIWCDCELTIRWLILDCHLTSIVSWKSSKSQVKLSKSQWKVNWLIDYTLTLAWLSLTETWFPEWLQTWLQIDLCLTFFDWNMTLLVNLKSQNTTSSSGLVNQLYMTLAWLLTDFLFYWVWPTMFVLSLSQCHPCRCGLSSLMACVWEWCHNRCSSSWFERWLVNL